MKYAMILLTMFQLAVAVEITLIDESKIEKFDYKAAPKDVAGKSISAILVYDRIEIKLVHTKRKAEEIKLEVELATTQGKLTDEPGHRDDDFQAISGETYDVNYYKDDGLVATGTYFEKEGRHWLVFIYGRKLNGMFKYMIK